MPPMKPVWPWCSPACATLGTEWHGRAVAGVCGVAGTFANAHCQEATALVEGTRALHSPTPSRPESMWKPRFVTPNARHRRVDNVLFIHRAGRGPAPIGREK